MRRVAVVLLGVWSTLTLSVLAASPAKTTPKIDPTADRVLRRMCQYLQGLQQFHVSVNEQFEMIRDSGQRIHYSDYRDVTIRRPNKVYSEVSGDMANRRFWYD